jgi:hypothetical protein
MLTLCSGAIIALERDMDETLSFAWNDLTQSCDAGKELLFSD